MTTVETASGSSEAGGNAGADTGIASAFDEAVKGLELEDDRFVPAAEEPSREPEKEQPVGQQTAPENAADDSSKAKAEKDDADAGKEKPKDEPATKEGEEEGKSKSDDDDVLLAPAHWDAEKREAFGKLEPEARKVVLGIAKDFEAGFQKRSTELAEHRQFSEEVRGLITDQHKSQLQSAGLSEAQGITHLIKLNDFATRDFGGYVRWALNQAGVTPAQLFPELATAQPTPGVDPGQQLQPGHPGYVPPQQQEPAVDPNHPLLEAVRQLHGRVQSFEEREQRTQEDATVDSIVRFREATDDQGNPTHPHYARVQKTMVGLVANHPDISRIPDATQRLERAYELACLSDPEIKGEMVDAEVAKRSAERQQQEDLDKARRAKPAAPAPATTSEAPKQQGLEAHLNSAMDLLTA